MNDKELIQAKINLLNDIIKECSKEHSVYHLDVIYQFRNELDDILKKS